MSTGASLEKSSLKWLDELTVLEKGNGERVGGVLLASAARTLTDLRGTYQKLVDDGGDSQRYTVQQQSARFNAIRKQVSDLVGPAEAKFLQQIYKKDLAEASTLGQTAGLDLDKILKQKNTAIQTNARPNMGAVENAGLRLKDFWAKENSSFRDRITVLTQTAAAQGKSYRQLSLQVRELLILERNQGTESARSTAVNNRLGIVGRAQLIARNELATAYVMGKLAKYREIGYSWARWSAAGERSCPYCIARDGLVYKIEDIESSIPAHPRCRCTPIPASPPMGWKDGGDPEEQAAQMSRDGDDAYWAKSRQEKLDQWAQRNNGKEVDLKRYIEEPTNTAKYLLGQEKAPVPVWAPSGSLSPNLTAVVLAANKAAQMTANEAQAADLAKQAKDAEKLVKQKAEEEAAAAQKAAEEAAAQKKAAEEAAALKAAQEAAAAQKAADLATVVEGFPAMKKQDVEDMFNLASPTDRAKLLVIAKETIAKAKAAAEAKDAEDFQLVSGQYGIDAATWKASEPSVKENLVTMAKKSIAEVEAIDLANKKLVEDWYPQEAGGWSGLTDAEKSFAIGKANAARAKDATDFALAQKISPGLEKTDWDNLNATNKAAFVKKAEDMLAKYAQADIEAYALVSKELPGEEVGWKLKTQAEKDILQEKAEVAKSAKAKAEKADQEAYDMVNAELPGQSVGWANKSSTEKADLVEAAEAKIQAKKDAANKPAPGAPLSEADFVAKWNSNVTAESYLASGPMVQKYALKLAKSTEAKSQAIEAGKTILETSLAKYTVPQLKSVAKNAGIDVAGLNKQGILDTLYQVQGGVPTYKPKGFYGTQKTPFEILIDPSLAPSTPVKVKKPTKAETDAIAKDQAIETILKANPTAKLGDLLVKDLATLKAQETKILTKLQDEIVASMSKPSEVELTADGKLVVGRETFAAGPTLAGSTRPVLYQDAAGTGRYVVKSGGKPGQNIAEQTSHTVYEILRPSLGIGGTQSRLTLDGKLVNTFIEGGRTIDRLSPAEMTKYNVSKAIRDGHMADALLANWDYVGMSKDNIMLDLQGRLSKIDAGGTFQFRAQGSPKDYGNVPKEVFSLRSQQGEPHWAKAIDSDYRDLWVKQTGAMLKNDIALRAAVRNSQLPPEVKLAYERRLDLMQQVGETLTTNNFKGKTIDEWVADKASGITWKDIDGAMEKAFDSLSSKGKPINADEWKNWVDTAIKKQVGEAVDQVAKLAEWRAEAQAMGGNKDRAQIEAMRGTSKGHFDGTLWDGKRTAHSGRDTIADQAIVQKVVDQFKKATGQTISKSEATEMMNAVLSYTNGGYTPMVADQLKRNNPEGYQIMLDNFKSNGGYAPTPRNGDVADRADRLVQALPVWRGGELVRGVGFSSETIRDRFITNITSGGQFGAIASWANGKDSSWGSGAKRVVLHVKDPVSAASVDGISSNKGENECLFPSDVRFSLVKQEVRGNVLHVYMKEIL